MWIDQAVKWLLPREDHFFDLLERGAARAHEISALLGNCSRAKTHADREAIVEKMHQVEHEAECVISEVYEATAKQRGYRPGTDLDPARLRHARAAFPQALAAGVTIINGSDIGPFPHGEGARELEPLFDHGMSPSDAIKSTTSVAERVLHLGDRIGTVRSAVRAEMIAVAGDRLRQISARCKVSVVMKNGMLYW